MPFLLAARLRASQAARAAARCRARPCWRLIYAAAAALLSVQKTLDKMRRQKI